MKYELDVAGKIQKMILPKEDVFTNDDWEIVGFMQPATEVGGDYYDFIPMEDCVRIAIGDVTDHRLESGVIMLMVQTAIKTMTEYAPHPAINVLTTVNHVLCSNLTRMQSDRSLTLAIVDLKQDVIQITGQHEDVIILRNGGTIEVISTEALGFPLGLIDEVAEFFNLHEVQINKGDVIILFTDGVTEAANQQKELYGIDRLCRVANEAKNKSAKEICRVIVHDVMNFISGNIIYDDITIVVAKK
jgi:sigma-B regulation protein RsbU (phosphoserine phosphatase)